MKHLLLIVLAALLLSACHETSQPNAVTLVEFDGGSLTDLDVQAHYQKMRKDPKFRDKPNLLTPETVFEHALNMEMIIALGLDKKLHLNPYVREEIHNHMSQLFLRLLQDELIDAIDRNSISDEEARAFYDENQHLYQKKALYRVSTFALNKEQADEAVAAIRNGALSFAEAAQRYALNEKEQHNGGSIGYRTLDRFRPHWREQVAALEEGQVAGPIELDGDWRLLLLHSKSEPHQYSFEEKKEYIRNDLLYQRYQDAWQEVYERLSRQFHVRIDQKALTDFYRDGINAPQEEQR